ncbi:MAG: alkaline phosphatase D family protein [Ramlibacter sp.]|nr:alkaline phosphatase D family protein [Ramlibacter sp.]
MDSNQDHSRRRFVLGSAGGMALALGAGLPLSGCGGGNEEAEQRFGYGVASGDPLADRVIIWTRVNQPGEDPTQVQWEVATDAELNHVVRSGTAVTGSVHDFTVKVDVTGLEPGKVYFYRFRHGSEVSTTGLTRTLPVGSASQVKLGVFSCAAFPLGQFHVYADASDRSDIDVALLLGDYIYETGLNDAEQIAATLIGRKMDPKGELHLLSEYRARYAQYHTDSSLRAFHAHIPVIAVWDDHEICNDTWRDGAGGHDPATEGSFAERRAAAAQAFHEWLPTRTSTMPDPLTIYRSFDFGNLLSLHMLDTRVIGRDAPLGRDAYLAGGAADPARQLMGSTQAEWLAARMQASTATWQVIGQQVLFGRMKIPLSLFDDFTEDSLNEYLQAEDTPEASRTERQRALVTQPFIPHDLNTWDGFEAAREQVLSTARTQDKNLVVLSGDSHNAWANNLRDASGQVVGVEFGTPSVTSTGLEIAHARIGRQFLADSFVRMMPDLQYAETTSRGYLLLTVTPDAVRGEWVFVSSVLQNSFSKSASPAWLTLPGTGNRTLVRAAS